jgi:hypothetical protein
LLLVPPRAMASPPLTKVSSNYHAVLDRS